MAPTLRPSSSVRSPLCWQSRSTPRTTLIKRRPPARRISNMTTAAPLRSYQTIATQTAPPGQLVLMLYEGAIRLLERAVAGFRHDDPLEFNATINNNVIRAQEILNELDRKSTRLN